MSEENRQPGAELTEAALEGVSGGSGLDGVERFLPKAKSICRGCRYCDHKLCDYGPEKLAEHLYEKRTVNITSVYECPFFNEARAKE